VPLINRKTNTEKVNSNSIGVQKDSEKVSWSDIVEQEEANGTTNVDIHGKVNARVVAPSTTSQRSEGASPPVHPPTSLVGVMGIATLLATLKVVFQSMDQFAINIQSKVRNLKVRGIIKMGSDTGKNGLWAVFDDVAILVMKEGPQMMPGKYVKLYGNCEKVMAEGHELDEYALLNPQDKLYSMCGKLAKRELREIMPRLTTYDGGGYGRSVDSYGHDSSLAYGFNREYGSNRGYGRDYSGFAYGGTDRDQNEGRFGGYRY
jgi:hypothetical protein